MIFPKYNKKFIIVLVSLLAILVLGAITQAYFLIQSKTSESERSSVGVVEIEMRVLKDQWRFQPEIIEAPLNSLVRIKIFNEDSYSHGFAIAKIGVNEDLPPNKTTVVEFIADKKGEFEFSCSVLCGKGHFEQKGKLIIN